MSAISHAVHNYISDSALVTDARSGDHSAFDELCRRHSGKLTKYIRRLLNDWSDTEDVLQETLFKAFTHLNSFQGRSSFSTWLTRIAINNAFIHLRRKRGVMVSIDDTEQASLPGEAWMLRDRGPDPECQLISKQQKELFAEGICRLPQRLRTVIELKAKEGYSAKEIAGKLGISESAAKSRLWRAQHLLQNHSRMRAKGFGRVTVSASGISRF